jgi:hypothetical protein
MANPTTNYSWPMPTSADLVTDLPADFAAFGQPVDTSLKALNPETTLGDIAFRSSTSNTNTRLGIGSNGQVLTVASGVPSWATASDQTPLTTKGDLFTFSTLDARLGIGANNTVLTADSAEATGMKWAAPAGGGKVLQVVQGTLTALITSSSTTLADTGLTVNITPSLSSSKILVFVNANDCGKASGNSNTALKLSLLRSSSVIYNMGTTLGFNGSSSSNFIGSVDGVKLDSPATTSSLTYKVQFASTVSGQSVFVNNYFAVDDTVSSITVMEIGA